ncbi:MAG: hypothetical protein L6R39_003886, partial [Caloplaca ligustica]
MSLRTLSSPLRSGILTPKSRAVLPPLFQSFQLIRPYVSGGPQGDPSTQRLKVWPFIFIFCAGSGAYVLMVN